MKKSVFILALIVFIIGQMNAQIDINGKVTDMYGEPVPGANVTVKGTTKGTVTNLEGNYTISDVPSDAILVFSFLGKLTEEVLVTDQATINLTLVEDILGLEEVVVIGYGVVRKRDLTGSVSSVKSEDIVRTPTGNVLEAIQGKVPGMDITRNSGAAGSGSNILIRGTRSIHGNNEPLYIIDGIQGGSIADLNANDIESIEVLKDASSTAIYGYQGSGGVVLITTKRAQAGKARVSYNGYTGVNGLTPYPKLRTGDDYIQLRREAYRTVGLWESPEDDNVLFPNAAERAAVDSSEWVDWHDMLIRNGTLQSHQITVSGGSEFTQALLSAGYFREEGVLKNDDMTRYNIRVNVDHEISSRAKAGLQAQVAHFDQNRRKDPLSEAYSLAPLGDPYNEDGTIKLYPVAGNPTAISPLADERPNIAKDHELRTNISANAYFELELLRGLTYRTNIGANLRGNRRGIYNDETSLSNKNTLNTTASVTSANSRYLNFDNILTFSRDFGEHSLALTGLTSYTRSEWDNVHAAGVNQLLASSLFYNLGATEAENRTIGSQYEGSSSLSYAGRVNYGYRGKYLLTVTNRVDGASRLSEDHRWASFPSVAGAWRISEEPFMIGIDFISNLKLRLSYGVAGNSTIQPYGTQSLVRPFLTSFGEVPAMAFMFENLVGNASVGWEKSASTNLGFDLGFFRNRLSATVDMYNTDTEDILLLRSLPTYTGARNMYQNIGSTNNKGIEIALNSYNIMKRDFKWTTDVTFTRNKEKITGLIDGTDIIDRENNSLVIGYPINSFYTYVKEGIWQLGEEEEAATRFANLVFEPGDIKISNVNGDSILDAQDRQVIGSAVPDFVIGLQNNFTYKSFELNVFLFARWGQMIFAEFLGRYNPSGTGNGSVSHDYWTPENPTNDFPRPERGVSLNNYVGYQSLNYVDGSYFKVKNVTLAYNLPANLTRRAFIDHIKVYVTASNLFTYTKSHLIRDYDPERGGSESFPLSKQIIFGVNVDF